MEYSVYSKFDLEKHKETFINYLEVIIEADGSIHYAVPSHQEYLIKLACRKLDLTRDELISRCSSVCDWMQWLCMITGAVSVWSSYTYAYEINEVQMKQLQILRSEGLLYGEIHESKSDRTFHMND